MSMSLNIPWGRTGRLEWNPEQFGEAHTVLLECSEKIEQPQNMQAAELLSLNDARSEFKQKLDKRAFEQMCCL